MENNQKGDALPVEPEITEKQAILFLINNGWLVNHDKELREKWKRTEGDWVITKLQHGEDVTCPFCNARPRWSEYGYYLHDNYCPECGADLRKDKSSGGISR